MVIGYTGYVVAPALICRDLALNFSQHFSTLKFKRVEIIMTLYNLTVEKGNCIYYRKPCKPSGKLLLN